MPTLPPLYRVPGEGGFRLPQPDIGHCVCISGTLRYRGGGKEGVQGQGAEIHIYTHYILQGREILGGWQGIYDDDG